MATDVPTVAAPPRAAAYTAAAEAASVDGPWAAWPASGAADDRAVRRTVALAAPVLILVAAVVIFALLGR